MTTPASSWPGIEGVRSRPRRSIQVEGHDSSSPVNPDVTRLAFVFAATIRQFQLRFAASARKKSFGSASPVFAVYKARSEQPFFVVWGPWTVPGLECKKSPEPYALFS